jgi:aspartyl-tRNA(Asn)/glutamyl-tRNA(Gln) amidotransferase subunit A
MTQDLCAAALEVRAGRRPARERLEASLEAADGAVNRHAYIRRFDERARAEADAIDLLQRAGVPLPPLAGLAVSVKDLFDVQGLATSAGSRVLAAAAAAAADCPAVARLRRAGAAITGHTNMSEFAFSGVGLNPHFPVLANPATLAIDGVLRIPGGSTSGGGASVAAGAAWAALGSDTGGSIRIPAALQGLVGFKSTARLVPIDGAVPLAPTLDTVSAMTRSVRDAVVLHEILAARTVQLPQRPVAQWRFAVPTRLMLDGLDETVARAFDRSLAALSAAGAQIETIDLPLLEEIAPINANGSFAAAESWAFHRRWIVEREAEYDRRVALRIRRGETMSAADYLELVTARRDWIVRMTDALQAFDALLSPTVPVVAPPLGPLVDDDEAFFVANNLLLRNPSSVNFLDGCALSLPCQRDNELPVGLMVWHGAGQDDAVLAAGLAIEAALVDGSHRQQD